MAFYWFWVSLLTYECVVLLWYFLVVVDMDLFSLTFLFCGNGNFIADMLVFFLLLLVWRMLLLLPCSFPRSIFPFVFLTFGLMHKRTGYMEQIRRRDGRAIVLFDDLLSALGGLNAECMMMRDGTRCEVFVFIIIFMVDFFSLAGLVHYYSFFSYLSSALLFVSDGTLTSDSAHLSTSSL